MRVSVMREFVCGHMTIDINVVVGAQCRFLGP